MLKIVDLDVFYGGAQVLFGLSLEVKKNEIVSMVGRNGAGKTTLMKTVMGLVRARDGSIEVLGQDITKMPTEKIGKNVGYVPDYKGLFPTLTVLENLQISAYGCGLPLEQAMAILDHFPALKIFLKRRAGTLSGGEQQMLTVARTLLRKSPLILMDEPTQGLAPSIIDVLKKVIAKTREELGIAFLIVEQDITFAAEVAQRTYGLLTGSVVYEGTAKDLIETKAFEKFMVLS
jgi:ABC-type branched-subunit amino acid transport system ATPase component